MKNKIFCRIIGNIDFLDNGNYKKYYDYLDKVIIRSRRRMAVRRCVDKLKRATVFIISSFAIYGFLWFFWSMLCYVFPDW